MDRKNVSYMTDEQRVKLIGLIKKYPFLYDKNHVVYNKKVLREKAWSEISKQVNADEDVCRQSWRSMRDQYYRCIYLMKKTGNPYKKYKHFNLLTFLTDAPQPRIRHRVHPKIEKEEMEKTLWMLDTTTHNDDDNNTNTSSQDNFTANFNEILTETSTPYVNKKIKESDSYAATSQDVSENSMPCSNKKRKLSDNCSPSPDFLLENHVEKFQNQYGFDKYDHFFLSLSSTVRDFDLPLSKFADLQCNVIKCVTTELEKCSK